MRERAELAGGTLELISPAVTGQNGGGTLVKLRIPRERAEAHGE
jgi:hypothetical protein